MGILAMLLRSRSGDDACERISIVRDLAGFIEPAFSIVCSRLASFPLVSLVRSTAVRAEDSPSQPMCSRLASES